MNPALPPQESKPLRDRLLDWTPEIAFMLVTTIAGLSSSGRWLDPTGDPGIWWSTISRLAGGERLYRDVYLQFGPLSPYLLSLGGRLFGVSPAYFLLANWIPAVLAGLLLGSPALAGAPFVVAGVLKLVYDGLLYRLFRRTVPSEEAATPPTPGRG